ncbi:MAG: hypothetical protein AAGJ46_01005 [Planctomycetota bacterium]
MRSVLVLLMLSAAWLAMPGFALPSAEAQPVAAKPRVFAPGVLEVIPPDLNPEETTSVHDIIELRANRQLNWQPKLIAPSRRLYSKAEGVRFRREIHQLEFAFKPFRMIYVDLPSPQGVMERRLVWYMVYRVVNRGSAIAPVEQDGGMYVTQETAGKPVKFSPHFVLEGQDVDAAGEKLYRAYLDRVIPAAVEPIRRRETPGRKLLTSVQMAEQTIPVSTGENEQPIWGVATWVDIDPEMDFFSVFVRGLTNAYRWEDPPGAYQAGQPPGTGRRFVRKTLQLNFWRPGDGLLAHESEVRFGPAPGKEALYGVDEGVAYRWLYR